VYSSRDHVEQQRRGVASRAAVTVPVSSSNRVEFHDWDSAGHSALKTVFLQATTGVCTYVALAVAAYGRAEDSG